MSVKRFVDLLLTVAGLPALAPVMLLLMALVRIKLGAPVFFTQIRPGLHGRPFRMIKLRTMTDGRDASGNLLPDSQRLTRFGATM